MSKKQLLKSGTSDYLRQHDVIRSIYSVNNNDTNNSKDVFSDNILLKYFFNRSLQFSYFMIIYAFIFSFLFPARENNIGSIIENYFAPFLFPGNNSSNNLMIFVVILFFIVCCLSSFLSFVSIIKYFQLRKHINKFYIYVLLSIISLIINTIFLLNNLFLLHFCIVGLNKTF